jgi:hypothetical protein
MQKKQRSVCAVCTVCISPTGVHTFGIYCTQSPKLWFLTHCLLVCVAVTNCTEADYC